MNCKVQIPSCRQYEKSRIFRRGKNFPPPEKPCESLIYRAKSKPERAEHKFILNYVNYIRH